MSKKSNEMSMKIENYLRGSEVPKTSRTAWTTFHLKLHTHLFEHEWPNVHILSGASYSVSPQDYPYRGARIRFLPDSCGSFWGSRNKIRLTSFSSHSSKFKDGFIQMRKSHWSHWNMWLVLSVWFIGKAAGWLTYKNQFSRISIMREKNHME